MAARAATAPRTPCEEALCAVWAALLGRDSIGVHDDFFALGGDSILALQAVGRARRAGWVFSVRQLFEHPTVAGLATHAQAAGAPANEGATTQAEHRKVLWEILRRTLGRFAIDDRIEEPEPEPDAGVSGAARPR